MKEIQKEIGEKLKNLRAKERLSQEELARQAGFSKTTVNAYENGNIKNLDTLERLCNFYDTSITELLFKNSRTTDIDTDTEQNVDTITGNASEKPEKEHLENKFASNPITSQNKISIIDTDISDAKLLKEIQKAITNGANVIYCFRNKINTDNIVDIIPKEYNICTLDFEQTCKERTNIIASSANIHCIAWNPFAYISKAPTDIFNLSAAFTREFKLTQDEKNIFECLLLYLVNCAPVSQRNLISITKLLRASDRTKVHNGKTDLDRLMEQLDSSPYIGENSFIFKKYEVATRSRISHHAFWELLAKLVNYNNPEVEEVIAEDSIGLADFNTKRIVFIKEPGMIFFPLYNLLRWQINEILSYSFPVETHFEPSYLVNRIRQNFDNKIQNSKAKRTLAKENFIKTSSVMRPGEDLLKELNITDAAQIQNILSHHSTFGGALN